MTAVRRSVADEMLEALAALDGDHVPGDGHTAARWTNLFDITAQHDVSVARLCEAHLDASAILREAGMCPRPGALYGVWASVARGGSELDFDGARLTGEKSFCSGIGIVDRALIDVLAGGRRQLLDVGVRFEPVESSASDCPSHATWWRSTDGASTARIAWDNAGLRATNTGTVVLVDVIDVEPVGDPDWYLERPGFWHGACGPAACWGGGAAGLGAHATLGDDPYRAAAAGTIAANAWAMRAILAQAGDEADARPDDAHGARRRARSVRHAVHELSTATIDTFVRAYGPRPLVEHDGAGQRVADVQLYLRQHHDRRDLAALADDLETT